MEKIKKYILHFIRFFGGILLYILIFFLALSSVTVFIPIASLTPIPIGVWIVISIITLFLYGIILYRVWKRSKVNFYISLSGAIVAFTFSILVIPASIQPQRPGNTQDGRRVADIKQMELAFNLYFDTNREFPTTESGCQSLGLLEGVMSSDFISEIPQEKFISEGHSPYQYAVSADRNQFVVKATLDSDRFYVDIDLDGNILGCDCNDPNYCVGSDNFSN